LRGGRLGAEGKEAERMFSREGVKREGELGQDGVKGSITMGWVPRVVGTTERLSRGSEVKAGMT